MHSSLLLSASPLQDESGKSKHLFSVRGQCHASAKVTREGKATTGTRGEGERKRERRLLEDGGKIFVEKIRLRRDEGAKIERMEGGGCQGFEVEILL